MALTRFERFSADSLQSNLARASMVINLNLRNFGKDTVKRAGFQRMCSGTVIG